MSRLSKVERRIGRELISAHCQTEAAPHAAWLLDQIEAMAQRGFKIRDGAQVPFGWVPLSLWERTGGYVVLPPDAVRANQEDVDLTTSLLVNAEQISLPQEMGTRPAFSTFCQRLIVAKDAWTAPQVLLSRLRPQTADDTGWTVLSKGIDAEAFEEVLVSDVVLRKRPWLRALALPSGYIVEFSLDDVSGVGVPPETH